MFYKGVLILLYSVVLLFGHYFEGIPRGAMYAFAIAVIAIYFLSDILDEMRKP